MEKIKVRFLGGHLATADNIWGGSIATTTAIVNAFKDDPEYDFKILTSREIKGVEQIEEFIKDADIVHIDENVYLAQIFEQEGFKLDVIGPTMRSPVKLYWIDAEKTTQWNCPFSTDWFYKHRVLRLNYQEEREKVLRYEYRDRGLNFTDKVDLVYHAINTEELKPSNNKKRKYILWAGDKYRWAKNYQLFEEIMNITKLPEGYEFKVLSGYKVQDYWDILDETAILINTSRYESFCCAMYEAQAKGVPTIYKNGMHGEDVHLNSRIQVEYTAEAYRDKILELLNDPLALEEAGKYNRAYAETFCSSKAMRDSFDKVYKEVLKND